MIIGADEYAYPRILRLVSLSLVAGSRSEGNLSIIKDIPLSYLRRLIGDVRNKEYMNESWQSWYKRTNSGNLPLEQLEQSNVVAGDINVHFFHDNAMLHQSDFVSSGFLHSSLYVLLENLICSNFQIKRASDAVLHVISATSNYPTVGHLVLANSDYVIDSICRQLRHLDLNPHVPSVLAAILSCIGVAHKILPLMEEPMRSISQELEILGRHQHPELTTSFLKEYMNESWQSWYKRTKSGKLVRQASTAACILNEMVFGLSDQVVDNLKRMFRNNISGWDVSSKRDLRSQLIDCIGSILHEYLSPEIWNLPLEQSNVVAGDINVHFFHDNAMLHQVMIDGIGIFNLSLKSDFVSSGFLHSSLYVLLENLICSNFQVKRASDAVLHVISAASNYPTVGHLVLANSDYMRSISQELEILGRHQHPELTTSFLKAVAEIAKASKLEASTPLLSSLKQTACLIALDIVEDGIVALAEILLMLRMMELTKTGYSPP
nr:TELO2-interacting protein 1 homolog [Tanacetum cinerariifolium]